MSAKGRGTEVQAADAYMTPQNLATACVDTAIKTIHVRPARMRILEPSAGVGAFVRPLSHHGAVTANEVDKRFAGELRRSGASKIRIGKTETLKGQPYDLILGNPPYSLAAEHVAHLMGLLKPDGRLFFLLRVNFLGARIREVFWNEHPPHALHVIRPRPYFLDSEGFRLKGKNGQRSSDATEYALFEWRVRKRPASPKPFRFIGWEK